jgi:hypothetical protein
MCEEKTHSWQPCEKDFLHNCSVFFCSESSWLLSIHIRGTVGCESVCEEDFEQMKVNEEEMKKEFIVDV